MTEKIPARFRKTKTEKWAVMAPIEDLEKALAEGGKIDVQKKSGDWSTFVVGSLGKPFDVDGVQMCYGYSPDDSDDAGGVASGSGGGRGASNSKRSSGGSSAPPEASGPASDPWLARQRADAEPPPASDEPMPEYQGGPEDEWSDF